MPKTATQQDQQFLLDFGQRVSERRKALGITQEELADRLGLSQQTVLSIEKGRRRARISILPELADVLSLSLDELLLGAKPKAKGPRGPQSKLQQQIELVRTLPRTKQRFVIEMLENVIATTQG